MRFCTGFSAVLAAILLAACSGTTPPSGGKAGQKEPPPPPRITAFYPSEPVAERGRPVLLCYGVENATSVRLTPPVQETLPPLPSRCVSVTLTRETSYTLTATSATGAAASQTLTLRVCEPRAAAARADEPAAGGLITTFAASADSVAAGQPTTVCYATRGAAKVEVRPSPGAPLPPARGCFIVRPSRSTTYTLTATSDSGQTESQAVNVRVR